MAFLNILSTFIFVFSISYWLLNSYYDILSYRVLFSFKTFDIAVANASGINGVLFGGVGGKSAVLLNDVPSSESRANFPKHS